MKLGFIIPTYPGERRVALLPHDIDSFRNELYVETGFGKALGIDDEAYVEKGCRISLRADIFAKCDAVFCLKLLQPSDYDYLRDNQIIIGWTHPTGSGRSFFETIAQRKNLTIVDLDNIYPTVYRGTRKTVIQFIPRNFIWRNSYIAGQASVAHALLEYGMMPSSSTRIAVLGSGNVSQGAYNLLSRYGADVRMFYRRTMCDFYDTIFDYDIIVNGIEVDSSATHIISGEQLKSVRKGVLIIDAAADAGNAIEGTRYTSIDCPIYEENGIYFYEVNNSPSIMFRDASAEISRSFSKWVYEEDVKRFLDIME